jgi:predicted permease
MWGMTWLEHAAADLRFAIRRLVHRPGFSLSALTVTALGIGATTAVFTAVDAAMLRPLPFLRPAELVTLTNVNIPFGEERDESDRTVGIDQVLKMPELFANAAAFAAGGLNLEDAEHPRRVNAGIVTATFFPTLGVMPERGRAFDVEEGRPNGPRAVILSDALWRSQFGGADVLGSTITLSGNRYRVVGVMPRGFGFPNGSDLWIPLSVPTTRETFRPFRGYLPSRVIARVAPSVSVDAASKRLLATWELAIGPREPGRRTNLDETVDEIRRVGAAVPLQQEIVGERRRGLLILMGATVLLLLIASANVANLLLSDGASRQREVALREVLGATRGRVVRQLLVESLVLALTGAVVGLVLAPAMLGTLRALMPGELAGTAPVHLDLRVLAFAIGLALVTGIAFGLWPAFGTSRVDPAQTIKSGGGGATASLGHARRLLIAGELALTVMLLVGAGLMLKSFRRLMAQDFGMNTAQVATLELTFANPVIAPASPPENRAAVRKQAMHVMLDRLTADPAVEAAGIVNDLPLRGGAGLGIFVTPDGMPPPKDAFARYLIASGGYFKALGIPILRGRTFTADDDDVGERVAIVSRTMATTFWPNVDAVGRTFHFGKDSTPYTVVGIVADVKDGDVAEEGRAQMYFALDERSPANIALVARGSLPPSELLSRLTNAVRFAAPRQAVFNARTMDDVVGNSVAPRRTNTLLISLFGVLALALSTFGVYAVVSYSVVRRRRELGIRSALGASRVDIVALVAREMAWVAGAGVGVGLVAAWALSRVVTSLLFDVTAHDAGTFALVPAALLVPALLATLVPTLRAVRASPTEVMRSE